MRKLFLAVSSMIVTGFLMKSYKKMKNCEEPESKEEVYRLMKAAHENHREIERRRAAARKTFAQMDEISTQRDAGLTSSIDTLAQMAQGRFA